MDVLLTAINRELLPILEKMAEQDGAPLWIELIPAGEDVVGRDGRAWVNTDPEAILEAFDANGADLPIDIEHATQLKGANGDHAPAAGWIKSLEVREGGSIWGLVEWVGSGVYLVREKEYRYISPVFSYNPKTGQIIALKSAGLTNNPNLQLTALNNAQQPPKETTMDKLLVLLGLSATATESDAIIAVNTMQTALTAAKAEKVALNTSLENVVPRADFDLAVNSRDDALGKLKAIETDALAADIETAINSALEAGTIAPASREYHVASCQAEGGLERFKAFAKSAPIIGAPAKELSDEQIAANAASLTEDEIAICRQFGHSEEVALAAKKLTAQV
jgi:phage I-like protein